MKIKALMLMLVVGAAQAKVVVLDELPEEMIKPCVRKIQISPLTREIIPMIPWRGVNLIFPFELEADSTHYSISGGDVWSFDSALKGSNIVPISFKKFDISKNWGTVQDFTISTKGYVFSLALHAVQDPLEHCSNVIFTITEEEIKRLEDTEKKNYQEVLKQDYQEKLANLDDMAEAKAMLLVASLANRSPKKERIKEEGDVEFPNGDHAVVYVKDIKTYGVFSTLSFDIENNSDELPLYIESVEVKKDGSNTAIEGVIEFPPKVLADTIEDVVFVTRGHLGETNMSLTVKTSAGMIEVAW